MALIAAELSVWDISFRWAGYDPDELWFKYPLAVKDNFRLIMSAIIEGEVICNTLCLDKRPFDSKSDPAYYIRTHSDDVYACIFGKKFNRKLLKWATINRIWFYEWCSRRCIDPPEFWFPKGWKLEYDQPIGGYPGFAMKHMEPDNERTTVAFSFDWPDEEAGDVINFDGDDDVSSDSLRPSQRAKIASQTIAYNLWKANKGISIADMARCKEILDLGGARPYVYEVVRRWLSEVAPAEVKARKGRPKKNNVTEID